MKVTRIGLHLAKDTFKVHGVNGRGVAVLRKRLRRDQVLAFFARLQPCLIGMEACGGAHYRTSKLSALGHQVRMMSPQFVKPYVKTNKNDALDAAVLKRSLWAPGRFPGRYAASEFFPRPPCSGLGCTVAGDELRVRHATT